MSVAVTDIAPVHRIEAGSASGTPGRDTAGPSIVLFALAVGGFAIGTTEFAAMSLLPYLAAGLKIDEPTAGHVISAYAFGVVVGAPTIAVLAAKLSRRMLLIGLMSFIALANLMSALAPSYGWMLAFRFLSGLPHGAYFGIAALTAASLVPPHRRAQAVARAMLGLTIATIAGVPLATWIGQVLGWRWGMGVVVVLALVTVLLLTLYVPRDAPEPGASAMRELGALKRRQVWLALAIGAIGFGGIFAVYTYVASTLLAVTQVSPAMVPVVLALFGIGMTLGTLVAAWLADRALMPSIGGILLWSALALAAYPFAAGNIWTISLDIFLIGMSVGNGVAIQTRLMDVAGDAQTLAAALNHSAFNTANAIGPLLGGMAIAAGYGLTSTGWVGCALAVAGLAIWAIAMAEDRSAKAGITSPV